MRTSFWGDDVAEILVQVPALQRYRTTTVITARFMKPNCLTNCR
ncbi:MAG: hypothetical protein ACLR8Y_17840 [Alistipes indistinctus]